jgi:hypothetical protein
MPKVSEGQDARTPTEPTQARLCLPELRVPDESPQRVAIARSNRAAMGRINRKALVRLLPALLMARSVARIPAPVCCKCSPAPSRRD